MLQLQYTCFTVSLPFSSPRGHYFASASYDRTARLWSTDHQQPLRIFAGHVSDVNVSSFCTIVNCYCLTNMF